MDIQQYILNNTGGLLPISVGNGQSQNQAVKVGSEAKYVLIQEENKIYIYVIMYDKSEYKDYDFEFSQN